MSEETQAATTEDAAATTEAAAAPAGNGVDQAATVETEAATIAERPDHYPEKFWDADTGTLRADDLVKSYTELERARQERVKNAPDDYHLPASFKGFEDQLPAQHVAALKELAKTESYSQKGFELLMQGTFGDPAAGRAALEAEFGDKTDETLQAVATFTNTLGDHAEAVKVMTSFPGGVKLLNAWRIASADKPLPGQPGEASGGSKTQADLAAMMKDPRYSDPYKRDPAFVAEVTEGFKKLHGGKQVVTAGANPGEFSGPGQLA